MSRRHVASHNLVLFRVLSHRVPHGSHCPRRRDILLAACTRRTDAIRFALDRSSPTGSEPLVSKVVERTTVVLQGGGKGRDDYSVLVRLAGCKEKKM